MLRTVLFACCIALLFAGTTIAQSQQKPPRSLPLGDKVRLTPGIRYAGTDNKRQRLDVYAPAVVPNEPLPLVVFIHGGAWQGGSKSVGRRFVTPLVESGNYIAASIGYRLSGEAVWPAQIHDCKAALRWLRANASQYNFDADRMAVWGASAGAHLAAIVGTSSDIEAMNGELGDHTGESNAVACVIDFFGPVDFATMTPVRPGGVDRSPMARLLGSPVAESPAKVSSANPVTYVTPDDSPFLIVHGTTDRLVPIAQSQLLDKSLEEVEVESTLLTVVGGGHGKGFPKSVSESVVAFLDHHLRGEETDWSDGSVEAE